MRAPWQRALEAVTRKSRLARVTRWGCDEPLLKQWLVRFSGLEDSYRTAGEGRADLIRDFVAGTDRIDLSALGFSGLGDGRDGTLAVQVSGERTYLKSFEADAEGRRFKVALDGDHSDLSAEDFLFAAPVATAIELIGVVQPEQAG